MEPYAGSLPVLYQMRPCLGKVGCTVGAMTTDSVQPHSTEAEEAVLGSLMIDGPQWAKVSPLLTPQMFFSRRHAQIFQAMLNVQAKGQELDQITVAYEIDRMELWEATGGGT